MKSKIILAIGLSTVLFSFFTACQREIVADPQAETGLSPKAEQLLAEQLSHYETVSYSHDAIYQKLDDLAEGATADIALVRTATAEPWVMHLTRNGVVQDDFRGTLFDGKNSSMTPLLGIRTFEGTVEGGGIVALTVSPTMIAGTIEKDGELWTLEPIQKFNGTSTGMAIAYREQDMLAKPVGSSCIEAQVPGSSNQRLAPTQDPGMNPLASNCWQIETMVHGDGHYLLQVGGNTNTAIFLMVAAINNSSARFTSINIHLFVPSGSAVQNTGGDNLSYDAVTLLNQVRTIDNAFFPNVRRDITLFFTGRNISGDVAGIAWQAVLCSNPSYAYGVAETINGSYNTRIQTHEIGHMLGASHDTACPNGGLMYPNVGSSCSGEYPSTTSKNQINWQIWFNHGCIQMASGC
jgi:hypothetical protein